MADGCKRVRFADAGFARGDHVDRVVEERVLSS
jgi:hypothetical protein